VPYIEKFGPYEGRITGMQRLVLLRWIGHLELPTARIDDGGEVASMA